MRINNNIMALNTHRQYSINNNNSAKSTEKLSSGYRINRAGDDAAGLAISEKMRGQIRSSTWLPEQQRRDLPLQTAEGADRDPLHTAAHESWPSRLLRTPTITMWTVRWMLSSQELKKRNRRYRRKNSVQRQETAGWHLTGSPPVAVKCRLWKFRPGRV